MPSTRARIARLSAVFCATLLSASAHRAAAQGAARTIAVRGTVEGEDIVRAARRYVGVRYVLGGSTPAAFDCSGFVRYVYGQFGIALPRTAHEQAAVGDAPFPGDLQPGDLLFFYGGRGAQHIAIYVGGDTIVHASSSAGRVKLDRLRGSGARRSWFNQRLIAVRRVAPAEGVFRLPAGGPPPSNLANTLATSASPIPSTGASAGSAAVPNAAHPAAAPSVVAISGSPRL